MGQVVIYKKKTIPDKTFILFRTSHRFNSTMILNRYQPKFTRKVGLSKIS